MKDKQARRTHNKRVYKVSYLPLENSKEALRRLKRELVDLVHNDQKLPIKKEDLN